MAVSAQTAGAQGALSFPSQKRSLSYDASIFGGKKPIWSIKLHFVERLCRRLLRDPVPVPGCINYADVDSPGAGRNKYSKCAFRLRAERAVFAPGFCAALTVENEAVLAARL
jgi:hypothetical protein